jgi:predicted acetyltransferase
MDIRNPNEQELKDILVQLNNEFIFSRGRAMPMEKRFPGLYSPSNMDALFGLFDSGQCLSFAATKPLYIRKGNKIVKGFEIGSVFTPPSFRHHGYSNQLLDFVCKHYSMQQFKAGYLWTSLRGYYEQFGWQRNDKYEVIIIRNIKAINENLKHTQEIETRIPNIHIMSQDDAIQLAKQSHGYIIRSLDGSSYFTTLPPSDQSITYITPNQSYLCGGTKNKTGYVFELISKEAHEIEGLLKYFFLHENLEEIWLNCEMDSDLEKIVTSAFTNIETRRFELQMCLPLDKAEKDFYEQLPIPFLDRI